MAKIDRLLALKPTPKLLKFTYPQIADILQRECQDFCDALTSEPELARQEIQKRITNLILTPKDTPDGPLLEVSGDVALLRTGDVLLQSPMEGIAQHYILPRISIENVVLDPQTQLAA